MKQSHKSPPSFCGAIHNLAQFKEKILKQRAVIRHELSIQHRNKNMAYGKVTTIGHLRKHALLIRSSLH